MKRKRNIWPFGKGQPLGAKSTHHRRASKPVSDKALAKQAKEREAERLESKLSDAQLEAKLRKHYSRGGNLREFLQANPGIPGAQLKRCNAVAGRKQIIKGNSASSAYTRYVLTQLRKANDRKEAADREYRLAEIEMDAKGLDSTPSWERAVSMQREATDRWKLASEKSGKLWHKKVEEENRRDDQDQRKRARKRNPSSDAAAVYEEFHGRPSSEVVTVTEKIHYHKNLAALGELRTLIVQARDGARVTLTRFKKAILCTNEAKNQLFVRGGDQSVDLQSFGIRTAHEIETLGRVVELAYFTTKDHLGDEGGTALYFHVAGETNENGKRKMAGWGPDLIYHTVDERLEFSGGSYTIRAEGVDK